MLRACKTKFLVSRIIPLAFSIPKVMAQMVKQGLEIPDEQFLKEDAMTYYECKFYSHLSQNWKIDQNLILKSELQAYNESIKKLQEFQQLKDLMDNLSQFYWELKALYLEITKEMATPNFWHRRTETTNIFVEDLTNSLSKYKKLMDELNEYPLWQSKVKNDIGFYIHMIYTSLQTNDKFDEVFKNFNRLDFLK